MLMNVYDLTGIVSLLADHRCSTVHLKMIDQGRYPGAIVFARTST
jgi:hypothetical protein